MQKQFNVGNTVKYTNPHPDGGTVIGFIRKVQAEWFKYSDSDSSETGYFVKWSDGDEGWISGGNLSLVSTDSASIDNLSVSDVKAMKATMETEILKLIQEFNKKTNLEVKDIELDYHRALGGECFYRVHTKLEI